MYTNVGRKIKTLSKVNCVLGIIGSVMMGIIMIAVDFGMGNNSGSSNRLLLLGGYDDRSRLGAILGRFVGSIHVWCDDREFLRHEKQYGKDGKAQSLSKKSSTPSVSAQRFNRGTCTPLLNLVPQIQCACFST